MEAAPIIAVAATATAAYYSKKNMDTQRKEVKAARAANARQYDLDAAQARLALEEEQRKNRNLLRQQQSAYRARLGAGGMSATSGTGQAVLDSLQAEHDTEDKYLVNQANISLEALLNSVNARNTQNLLSLSALNNRTNANTASAISRISTSAGRSVLK